MGYYEHEGCQQFGSKGQVNLNTVLASLGAYGFLSGNSGGDGLLGGGIDESDLTFTFGRYKNQYFDYSVDGLTGRTEFTVDWGDGTKEVYTGLKSKVYINHLCPSHTYAKPGNYIIAISNDLASFLMAGNTQVVRLIQWGEGLLRGCHWDTFIDSVGSFYNCTNLVGPIPAFPKGMTRAYATFSYCYNLDGVIPKWGESLVDVRRCYIGDSKLAGVWNPSASEEEIMPPHITTFANAVSATSGSLRSYFYTTWGGTKAVPTA